LDYSPKGWDYSAQGNALGHRYPSFGSLKGCDLIVVVSTLQAEIFREFKPRALPWAE